MWEALAGGVLGGLGGYFGAKEQTKAAADAARMSEKAKAWTQLLGMGMLEEGAPGYSKGMDDYFKAMQGAAGTLGQLPGMAQQGQQAQMGQLAGAETGAISQVNRANKQMMAGAGQSAASSGFYGSSIQGGQTNQMQANTNQSIADIMAGVAGQKSNVIGQGTQNMMQGLMGQAQGQQAAAQAGLTATQGKYNLTTDKINMLLATANQFNVGDQKLRDHLAGMPEYADFMQGPPAGGGGGNGWDVTGGWGKLQDWGSDLWGGLF